jgi:outer membrane protein assembly factor BamB
MRKFSILLTLTTAVALAACGDGVNKLKLEGERVYINVKKSALVANPAALETGLRLPRTTKAESWSQTGGNAEHSLSNLVLSEKVVSSWKTSLGGGNTKTKRLMSTPVYANGAIFAANTDGEVFAISEEYGKKLWEVQLEDKHGDRLNYAPALAVKKGKVFAALSSGDVVALEAELGQEIWRTNLDLPLRSAPSVDDNFVYVIAHNNSFYALELETGFLKWTHNGIEEQLAILGGPSAAISKDGVVVVPYSSGEIYALSQKDGRYLWYDALSVNVGSDLYSSLVDVEASPVIADDVVYAVNHNGQLSAFDIKNGRRFWSVALSATQMPWVVGSVIYVVTENDQIVCINRRDGLIRWIQDLASFLDEDAREEEAYWAGPVLAGDRLFVTSSNGYVLTLDPFDGDKISSIDIGESVSLPPIIADERLVLFTDKARLITFK